MDTQAFHHWLAQLGQLTPRQKSTLRSKRPTNPIFK